MCVCFFFFLKKQTLTNELKLVSVRRIPGAGEEEHRVVVVKDNGLEHMWCLRLVFVGWSLWRLVGEHRDGLLQAPGWAFRTFGGLAPSCPWASSLPISFSISIFIIPADGLYLPYLLFHSPMPFFIFFAPNLLFLSGANYCLSFKTKFRCPFLQAIFHSPPDVQAFF